MRLQVLYGGTFDPVHLGHLNVARHARDALNAKVALMPAADPPHRGPTQADAAQRAHMLQLAVTGEPGLRVDLRELQREGPSYTVDTLHGLRAEVGATAPWAILIGEDSFRALDTWHRWRELFELAHIVIASRANATGAYESGNATGPITAGLSAPLDAQIAGRWAADARELTTRPAGLVFALHQMLFPQSASELRRRIATGDAWQGWVTPAVAAYIERQGLYR